jgi:hypothetical protein
LNLNSPPEITYTIHRPKREHLSPPKAKDIKLIPEILWWVWYLYANDWFRMIGHDGDFWTTGQVLIDLGVTDCG